MSSRKTAVILQPTFLPWVGWFDLADQADILVILDDVGFSKQSWQQRNRLRTPAGLAYVTVPVRTSGRLGQRIVDTEISGVQFAEKLIRTVSANYARAAHFADHFGEFSEILRESAATERLCVVNERLIAWLSARLDVTTPTVRSSELGVEGRRGELVARLCERLEASHYLSPAGAEEYLLEDRAAFDERGIAVSLHVYEHPTYRQVFQPFMPYASVLDLLLNEGDQAGAIMRTGRRPARPLGVPGARDLREPVE